MKNTLGTVICFLDIIFSNEFFKTIKTAKIAPHQWEVFLTQKYGSVGYFIDFLRKGSELCKPHSELLHDVFRQNWNDEMGIINGTLKNKYMHETWRLNSLKEFGLTSQHLREAVLLPTTQLHSQELASLPKSDNFLEYCGALLFLELFVVQEMKHLINAFERTMPSQFPKNGYRATDAPNNTHEYWYNHRTHDVGHYKQIKKALTSYFEEYKGDKEVVEIWLTRGVCKVFSAKSHLYDTTLLEAMLNA